MTIRNEHDYNLFLLLKNEIKKNNIVEGLNVSTKILEKMYELEVIEKEEYIKDLKEIHENLWKILE